MILGISFQYLALIGLTINGVIFIVCLQRGEYAAAAFSYAGTALAMWIPVFDKITGNWWKITRIVLWPVFYVIKDWLEKFVIFKNLSLILYKLIIRFYYVCVDIVSVE